MKCPKCNAELPQDARFCSSCGFMLNTAEAASAQESPAEGKPKKYLFLLFVVLAAAAILLGIFIGRLIAQPGIAPQPRALPSEIQDTQAQPSAGENASPVYGSDIPAESSDIPADASSPVVPTPEAAPVSTPAPTPELTPEPVPQVFADADTLLQQFREIRGALRSEAVRYVNGPLVLIPYTVRNEVYERIAASLSQLSFVSECSTETSALSVTTDSGMHITLGQDGHITLIDCPANLAGNAVYEKKMLRSLVSGSDFSSDAEFAACLDEILDGSIGLYSYSNSNPTEEISVPVGTNQILNALCYINVGCSGNLYNGSENVIYSSAVYNALWGECPLSIEEGDAPHSRPVLRQSGRVSGQQMYTSFTSHGVMPGALLVAAPTYANGDTLISTAILLGYDDRGVDLLYSFGSSVFVIRTDWANFSYIFAPEGYLQTVYQPDADYIRSRFPLLESPAYMQDAAAFNPDPDTLDAPNLSIYGQSVPYSIAEGGSFGIYGNVSTDVGEIRSVTVFISDSYGNVWQTHTVTPEAGCKTLNLNSYFNLAIRFGGLSSGNYRYTVRVTAASGSIVITEDLISQSFNVSMY